MKNFKISRRFASGSLARSFSELYLNNDDPLAKSRGNIMFGNMFAIAWSIITTGVFFVGFLQANGASDTMIGTVNMTMIACGLLQLFSPLILERFKKRKRYLLAMRGIYGFIYFVIVSALPLLPFSREMLLALITTLIILSAIIQNGLMGSGYSTWHIQSVPEKTRINFFSFSFMANTAVNIICMVSAGAFLDNMTLHGFEMYAFLALRLVAFVLILLEMFFYGRSVELPYADKLQRVRLKALFLVPMKHKPFLLMMSIMMFWSFLANLAGTYYLSYLLQDLGQSYRLISLSSAVGTAVMLLSTPMWNKIIRKTSWLSALIIALPTYAVVFAGFGFVFRENIWLYVVCVIGNTIIAPAINLVAMNLPFMHTPKENQTMFLSMFTTGNAIAAFAGVSIGNFLMIITQNMSYEFLGMVFGNKQTMCFLQAFLMIIMMFGVIKIKNVLSGHPAQNS